MFRILLQWVLAPLAIYLLARWASPTAPELPLGNRPSETREATTSIESLSKWRNAQAESHPIKRLSKGWQACEEMSDGQLADAYREAVADENVEAMLTIGDLWAQRDPQALIEHFQDQEITPYGKEASLLQAAYLHWSAVDASAAFTHAQSSPSKASLTSVANELAIAFLSEHPSKLDQVSLLYGSSFGFFGAPKQAFTGDVLALAQSLRQASSEIASTHTINILGQAILTSTPTPKNNQRFWTWWQALSPEHQAAALPILNHRTPDGIEPPPEARTRLAQLAQEDHTHVSSYMRYFGEAWSKESPNEAFDWVLERFQDVHLPGMRTDRVSGGMTMMMGGDESTRAFEAALQVPTRELTRQDPQSAIDSLEKVSHLRARSTMAREIARIWASFEPEQALAWAETLPAERLRNDARRDGLTAWAKEELQAATAYSLRKDTGSNEIEHLQIVAGAARSAGQSEAVEWLVSLPVEKIEPLLGHFISHRPQLDRLRPFQEALENLPASEGKQETLSLIDERTSEE